jgi:tyrosine-specific transport protein
MKIVGSILLVIAMSIGGGLLSLPAVTSESGFIYSCLILFFIWLVMTIGAFFILEVCLQLPKGANLISMAKDTLGIPGKLCMLFCYLILLYCIMCVYISGGTDLINSIFTSLDINITTKLSTLIFTISLGCITWFGINLVDKTNRILMSIKMILLFLLILTLIPSVDINNLIPGDIYKIQQSILPIIFSFGFAIIIPSLRDYLENDVKSLRLVIIIGSVIPLVCFILWIYVVQGVIPHNNLQEITQSGEVISALNIGLSNVGNPWVTTFIHLFTTICLLTAFLAVSLSLSDFISNGINKPKKGLSKYIIFSLTFLPPLMIIIFKPYIFISAIHYAGILIVIVLILLPTLMMRKIKNIQCNKRSSKVQALLINSMAIIAIILLLFTCYQA